MAANEPQKGLTDGKKTQTTDVDNLPDGQPANFLDTITAGLVSVAPWDRPPRSSKVAEIGQFHTPPAGRSKEEVIRRFLARKPSDQFKQEDGSVLNSKTISAVKTARSDIPSGSDSKKSGKERSHKRSNPDEDSLVLDIRSFIEGLDDVDDEEPQKILSDDSKPKNNNEDQGNGPDQVSDQDTHHVVEQEKNQAADQHKDEAADQDKDRVADESQNQAADQTKDQSTDQVDKIS